MYGSCKRHFSLPSLLTRRSALVLKWVCRKGGKAFKRGLVHSVSLIITVLLVINFTHARAQKATAHNIHSNTPE